MKLAAVVVLAALPTLAHAGTPADDTALAIGGSLVFDGGGGAGGAMPAIEAIARVRGDQASSIDLRGRFGYGLVLSGQPDGGLAQAAELQVLAGLEGHMCSGDGTACVVLGASAIYDHRDMTLGLAGFGAGGTIGFEVGSVTTRFRLVLDVSALHAEPQDAGLPADMERWVQLTSVGLGVTHQL